MIPLSIPHLAGNEWEYIKECLDTNWVSSVGTYVDKFEAAVAEFTGAKYAIACMNGTAALHVSLLLSGVQPDDYVIVPNITFIASINSIKYCFADPILIDMQPNTWQMDLDLLETFLEKDTEIKDGVCTLCKDGRPIRCMMPVHVLGNMANMARLMQIAKKYHLTVVEDSTEALGSFYDGKHSGTFGKFGTFSFNGNKIITTGGGGMIVTDDEALAKKAKHLTTQAKSDSFEYIHDEIGYNYRLVNILAAMGVAQMEQLSTFLERKHAIRRYYEQELNGVGDIQFQQITEKVQANDWLITIKTKEQKGMIQHLTAQKIQCRPFWRPMNQLQMFKNDPYITTEDISNQEYQTCLSIPCSSGITDAELQTVAGAIKSYFKK